MKKLIAPAIPFEPLLPGARTIPGLDFFHIVIHEGEYPPHPNPMYRDNPFIEALPQYFDADELAEDLEWLPEYDPAQLLLPPEVRVQLVMSLVRFFLVLPRTLTLAGAFIKMLMEGYVGRLPYDRKYHELLVAQWERRMRLRTLPSRERATQMLADAEQTIANGRGRTTTAKVSRLKAIAEEISSVFLGDPGTGKSKTLKHFVQLYETPIYHAQYHIWQLPVIFIRFPPDGRSLHSLATAIIAAIDRLLPVFGYAEQYLRSGRNNGNSNERLIDAETLLHRHQVGMVLADEAQDAKFATDRQRSKAAADPNAHIKPEGEAPALTLLLAAANRFGIPLLLVGTKELHDVMKARASRGRRAVGYRIEPWGLLEASDDLEEPGEFELFFLNLFQFRWTTQAFEPTPTMAAKFAELTQRNPDLIVKLFIAVQIHAIEENSKVIDEALVERVFDAGFDAIEEALKAIAENDPEALMDWPEFAPLGLRPDNPKLDEVKAEMLEANMRNGVKSRRARKAA